MLRFILGVRSVSKTNRFKRYIKANASALVAAATLLGVCVFNVRHIQPKDTASAAQIKNLYDEFDCETVDMHSFLGGPTIFAHNSDEPIYVQIDGSCNEAERVEIIAALNEIFGIVGRLNPNYYYQIVDNITAPVLLGQSTIFFRCREINKKNVVALEKTLPNLSSPLSLFKYRNCHIITYDRENCNTETSQQMVYDTMLHELLHTFQFLDVYATRTNVYQGNTLMQPAIGATVRTLSGNDIKCLAATYAPKFETEQQAAEYIKLANEMAKEYEERFLKSCAGHYKDGRPDFGYENFALDFYYPSEIEVDGLKISKKYHYNVVVYDGGFNLKISDEKGNVLENSYGAAELYDGVMVLKDVRLNKGLGLQHLQAENNIPMEFESMIGNFFIVKKNDNQGFYFVNEYTGYVEADEIIPIIKEIEK